jgi:hypothetical protein
MGSLINHFSVIVFKTAKSCNGIQIHKETSQEKIMMMHVEESSPNSYFRRLKCRVN